MKNAIIGALLIMLALVWLNARGDAQPMIQDTTKIDFPVCVTIHNGPIHPDYSTNLHGRRSDNA